MYKATISFKYPLFFICKFSILEACFFDDSSPFCSQCQIHNVKLRSPKANDIARLLERGEERGFPGMLGVLMVCTGLGKLSGGLGWSIFEKRWIPKPRSWGCSIPDLWIWHANFGLPGSNNDINVLQASHLFVDLAQGKSPPANYTIQGKEYISVIIWRMVYPKWSTLVQSISQPQEPKKQYYAMMQEAC